MHRLKAVTTSCISRPDGAASNPLRVSQWQKHWFQPSWEVNIISIQRVYSTSGCLPLLLLGSALWWITRQFWWSCWGWVIQVIMETKSALPYIEATIQLFGVLHIFWRTPVFLNHTQWAWPDHDLLPEINRQGFFFQTKCLLTHINPLHYSWIYTDPDSERGIQR